MKRLVFAFCVFGLGISAHRAGAQSGTIAITGVVPDANGHTATVNYSWSQTGPGSNKLMTGDLYVRILQGVSLAPDIYNDGFGTMCTQAASMTCAGTTAYLVGYGRFGVCVNSASSTGSFTMDGLLPGVGYTVQLIGYLEWTADCASPVPVATLCITSGVSALTMGAGQPPVVTTLAASSVTGTTATLNGTVNPNNLSTSHYFEWGTTVAYGNTTSVGLLSPGPLNGACTTLATAGGWIANAVSAGLTGLTGGQTYHFRVVATNAQGTTYGGDQQFAAAQVPSLTTNPATGVGSTTATLNGVVTTNGLTASWWYEYGTGSGVYPNSTPGGTVPGGTPSAAVSVTLSGLLPNSTYYFRLAGANANGTGYGIERSYTTGSAAPPTAITGAASGVSTVSAILTGTVNPAGSATMYWFEWGTSVGYGNTTPSQSAGNGTSNAYGSYPLSGLTSGQTYHYRVVAQNASGTGYGSDVAFTTGATNPPAVTTGSASSVGTTSATLGATINPNSSATSWYVEYGPTTSYGQTAYGGTVPPGSSNVSVNVTITGLTPGTLYHWRPVGTNGIGGRSFAPMAYGTTYGADSTFSTTSVSYPGPTVTTEAASNVGYTGVVCNATVNFQGDSGTYWFELSTSPGGPYTITSSTGSGAGATDVYVSRAVSTLSQGTTYYARAGAQNSGGTTYGADVSFVTDTAGVGVPIANTLDASNITTTGAVLNGTYQPNGASSSQVWFEWGTSASSLSNATSIQNGVGGSTETSYSRSLTTLTAGGTYYFRLACSTPTGGTAYGATLTFTTSTTPVTYLEFSNFKCKWKDVANSNLLGGSGKRGLARKSRASLTFTGTGIDLYSMLDKTLGKMKITIDGAALRHPVTIRRLTADRGLVTDIINPTKLGRKSGKGSPLSTTVDLYTPGATQFQEILYSISGLSSGQHTLRVDAVAPKGTKRYHIFVDAVRVRE
ncbi:MAG: hypothetical protein HYX75_15145 [Acidobacteria bacterium]|nr:hypothetical protein [Acidobacteriota bacterium]